MAAIEFQSDRGASAPPTVSSPLSVSVPPSISPLTSFSRDCLLLTGPVSPDQEVSVEALLKKSDLSPELLLQALLPLTTDSGPLTLQGAQDFPHGGRSQGGGAL